MPINNELLLLAPIDVKNPYGSSIRPYNFYKYLVRFGCHVNLLTFRSLARDYTKFTSVISALTRSRRRLIMFSGLHPLWTLMFSFLVKVAGVFANSGNILISDFHGSVFHEYRSYGWRLRSYIYYALEFLILKLSDLVIVASEELKKLVMGSFKISPQKLKVVGNGVELPSVGHATKLEIGRIKKALGTEGKKVLVMVAPRNSYSNVLAVKHAQRIMRELGKIRSDVILLILGGGKMIDPVPENVKYLGHVDEKLYRIILSEVADIAIAPYPKNAVCGGARNKILDYWGHKILVVSTLEGMRGITEAESHFILSDYSVEGFVQAILRVLEMDEGEKYEIINEAYNMVKAKWLWGQKAQQLLALISNIWCR